MGYLNYTPSRSLIGSSDGKLETDFQRATPAHKDKLKQVESLDGSNVETNYLARVQIFSVKTGFVEFANWAKWEEFWHSVAGGESFTFDAYGTEASPVNAVTVKLVPSSWKLDEPGPRHHVYNFKVRAV